MLRIVVLLLSSQLGSTGHLRTSYRASNLVPSGQLSKPSVACSPKAGAALVDGDWTDFANTTVPTRTLNYGPDPGCTSTAERLQIPATSTAQFSGITNITICPIAVSPVSFGCWVKGTTASGTTDYCNSAGDGYQCTDLAFTTAFAWKTQQNVVHAGGGGFPIIGNISAVTTIARSAVDIQVWGCRCVQGATIDP